MKTTKVIEIQNLVGMLSNDEQEALLKGLRKQILLSKAELLNKSVLSNDIKMQDILEGVRKVRKARYEKHPSSL